MAKNPVIDVFAVHYEGPHIDRVRAAVYEAAGASKYVELSRCELLKHVEHGAEIQAIDVNKDRKLLLGRVSLVESDTARYFSLHCVPAELDDLGDLPQY